MGIKAKRFLIVLVPLLIVAGVVVFNSFQKDQTPKKINSNFINVEINGKSIRSEIAKTPPQITKGLSDRKSLPKDEGMLFYLGEKRIATFWMKDMLFPIDIIWIDSGQVVYIVENAQPPISSTTPTFTPDKPATHVLEVNADFIDNYNIDIDDNVFIPNIN